MVFKNTPVHLEGAMKFGYRPGEAERRAIAAATETDARLEASKLWASAAAAAPLGSESLVSGFADAAARWRPVRYPNHVRFTYLDVCFPHRRLVADVFRSLPDLDRARTPRPDVPTGGRPARPLVARATWDHPVAQDACLASGVPGLGGFCGR